MDNAWSIGLTTKDTLGHTNYLILFVNRLKNTSTGISYYFSAEYNNRSLDAKFTSSAGRVAQMLYYSKKVYSVGQRSA